MKLRKTLTILSITVFIGGLLFNFLTKNKGDVASISTQNSQIKGMVLPHHDLAREIFTTSLLKLQESQSPPVFVIFGTNHYYPDSPTLTTAVDLLDYPIEKESVIAFVQEFPSTQVSTPVLEKEHSITTPVPYIRQYFPEAKIIPLIVSSRFKQKDLDEYVEYLSKTLPEDTVYIAAVDFSHGQTLESGMSKNEESIKVISEFDYETLYTFKDDHLDSPVAIGLFLETMQVLDSTRWETWESTHGALLTSDPTLQGTSYVIGVFR
jgi:AmmeMemoRadiSam system protein B